MIKLSNKGIFTPFSILIILLAVAITGGVLLLSYQSWQIENKEIEKEFVQNDNEDDKSTETDSKTEEDLQQEEEKKGEEPNNFCQNECSQSGFKKCSGDINGYQTCGDYDIDNCLEWSLVTNCPLNTICQNGMCIQQKCTDGTFYGQCSIDKPKYCENGNLVNKCSICNCPLNYICDKSSNLCRNVEKLDMLIFVSPQYAGDSQIKQAINEYIEVVKEDIGWNVKIINITPDLNDFRKIDKVIENHYNSVSGLKAALMVGEDIDTPLGSEGGGHEAPSIVPWGTTGGEISYEEYNRRFSSCQGDFLCPEILDSYHIRPSYLNPPIDYLLPSRLNIAIFLLYPSHEREIWLPPDYTVQKVEEIDYQIRSQQIVNVFEKFKKDRQEEYLKNILSFWHAEIAEVGIQEELIKSMADYVNLYYKKNPSEEEIMASLEKEYMMYIAGGHGTPMIVSVGPGGKTFEADYLDSLNTPFFVGSGCYVGGWPTFDSNNRKIDFSHDRYDTTWFGSKIFNSSYLKVIAVGFPFDPASDGKYYFIKNILQDLMTGKTLAESIAGKIFWGGGSMILYGDPTFHFNF